MADMSIVSTGFINQQTLNLRLGQHHVRWAPKPCYSIGVQQAPVHQKNGIGPPFQKASFVSYVAGPWLRSMMFHADRLKGIRGSFCGGIVTMGPPRVAKETTKKRSWEVACEIITCWMSNIDQISVLRKLMWNVGDKHTFFCHVWMWKVGPQIRNMDNSWGCQEVAKMILVHVVSILNCRFEGFKTMFLEEFIIFLRLSLLSW